MKSPLQPCATAGEEQGWLNRGPRHHRLGTVEHSGILALPSSAKETMHVIPPRRKLCTNHFRYSMCIRCATLTWS